MRSNRPMEGNGRIAGRAACGLAGVILLALVLLPACSAKALPYGDEIQGWRAQKDRFMREASDSPVPPEKRASFPALAYFATDPDYRVPASLEVRQSGSILEM